jgi:glutaredoxin
MNALFRITAAGLALCATVAGAQELFRWVDKDGKVHFSDTPPPPEAKGVQQKRYATGGGEGGEVPYAVKVAMEKNPVTLYANSCEQGCAEARALLSKRGVPYTDKNPETDPKASDALKALAGGQLYVPTLTIGDNVIKGFMEESWQSALTAAGYPRTNPNVKPDAVKPAPPKSDAPPKS